MKLPQISTNYGVYNEKVPDSRKIKTLAEKAPFLSFRFAFVSSTLQIF